jgi:NTP pyrophosphatase (non-canonical NTP hydrolase)
LDESNTTNASLNEASSSQICCWTDLFLTQSIGRIQQLTRQFAVDRDWLQYHTPRNLALALMGEIGELAEIFQFMGDDDATASTNESATSKALSVQQLDKVGQELADVTIYLCRLSDVCQIKIRDVHDES